MIRFSIAELASLMGVSHINGDAVFDCVSTDSRTISGDALFVAIPGENFDGHDYVAQAADKGAVAALVDRELPHAIPQLVVPDVLKALGQLTTFWREKARAKFIALTGSNGKTTVKEMIAAILQRCGTVLATRGNLNNDIGVPLTVTRIQDEEFAVIEMGANHPGEIHYLSTMVSPDIALLNNAGRAHLEGFGSLEGVARSKAEIIDGLDENGIFVCNGDSEWLDLWFTLAGDHRIVTFGSAPASTFHSANDTAQTRWDEAGFHQRFSVKSPEGSFEIELPLAGDHNRMNALAAIAVAQTAGASVDAVRTALASLKPVKGRLQPLLTPDGVRLINDSYNANPDSVAAAIEVLVSLPGRHILVLGDLGELGDEGVALHAEIGTLAKNAGIDQLFTFGPMSAASAEAFGDGAEAFTEMNRLIEKMKASLHREDIVLVKGSRSARMERAVEAFVGAGESQC